MNRGINLDVMHYNYFASSIYTATLLYIHVYIIIMAFSPVSHRHLQQQKLSIFVNPHLNHHYHYCHQHCHYPLYTP